jgi:hypothetical protein
LKHFIEGTFVFNMGELSPAEDGQTGKFPTLKAAYQDACKKCPFSWIEVDVDGNPTGAQVHSDRFEGESYIANRSGNYIYQS